MKAVVAVLQTRVWLYYKLGMAALQCVVMLYSSDGGVTNQWYGCYKPEVGKLQTRSRSYKQGVGEGVIT